MLIFVDLGYLCCLRALAAMISLNPVAFLYNGAAIVVGQTFVAAGESVAYVQVEV